VTPRRRRRGTNQPAGYIRLLRSIGEQLRERLFVNFS
jgi:hypothetical protein